MILNTIQNTRENVAFAPVASQGETRTSLTDPLKIATLPIAEGYGRLGITLCPGKKDQNGLRAKWDRDLELDLDAVRDWGAVGVVTLIEPHELEYLCVEKLQDGVLARHMLWWHLPIRDVDIPDANFEYKWAQAGDELRAILRSGGSIVIHCRGGLGRAGTVAARLLVEFGYEPNDAIQKVRSVRPGAIETRPQEQYVCTLSLKEETPPASTEAAKVDRAVGALLGLAVGDAVGTTLEFCSRDDAGQLHTDMIGGGPFQLAPGQWTDDTSLALALADSLLKPHGFNEGDLLDRFVSWWRDGTYSCTGRCFDIGITTREALLTWLATGNVRAGAVDPRKAGNGSLMRLAPVAIRYWNNPDARREIAARQSCTTHGAPEAIDACILYADMLADAISGQTKSQVLRPRSSEYAGRIGQIASGSWRDKRRSEIRGTGYVAAALEAAIWCVATTPDFRGAILRAANLREDADTTAAIAGQLAGAIYGVSGIPRDWRAKLAWGHEIEKVGRRLFSMTRSS